MFMRRSVFFKGVCLLAVMAGMSAFAQKPPESVVSEIPAGARVPKGTYRPVRAWEAESLTSHMTGAAADDPSASGGKAWDGRRGADAPNRHLIFGPYLDVLEGNYVAFFRLKLLEKAEDDIAARVDASVGQGVTTLCSKDVWTGDLSCDRYVQIPMAFHSSAGKLECRLYWNGYAGLRLDSVSLFALDGAAPDLMLRAPSAAPSGLPNELPYRIEKRPFPDVFPRSQPPQPQLTVFDLEAQPYDRRMLLLCLQGLVNRERPSLYAILDKTDRQWLDWMKRRGWVAGEETLTDPMTLLQRFRDKVKGVVIYDPRLASSKNVAMMIASLKDGLVASPRLARELGLPVLDDLRGRWKTHAAAYRWAFDTLWPQLNHFVLACLYPEDANGLRDYLYQQRVFTFWITGPIDGALPGGDPTAEAQVMEQVLAQAPANIPVMGFPWAGDDVGIGEGGGVRLCAQYGKFLVGAVGVGNLSVHSGYASPAFKQRRSPAPALQPDKVYLTWLMSDGDNLPVLSRGNFPQLWSEKARGSVPIAWSLSPCAVLMIPAIVDYYYASATPSDAFVGSVSGVGYTYPDDYATRFTPEARTRLFGDFLGLTRQYLPRSDLQQIWVMGVSQQAMIGRYAAELPEVDAIFPDYGKRLSRADETFYLTARGVPVFHAVTHWEERATRARKIELLVEQIRAATPTERPAFLHAFIWNWGADLSVLPEVMGQLGPQYVAVGPDHLAALAKQHTAQQKVLLRSSPGVVAVEGHPFRFQVSAYNATSAPLPFRIAATEGLREATLSPAQGEMPPFGSVAIACQGKPAGSAAQIALSGPWGERSMTVALSTVPSAELAGALPGGTLRFADRFDAAGLSHRSGSPGSDPKALEGRVWAAKVGEAAPGHIVFGPYKPFPAGRYVALFQIKRTGEGAGVLARIDVHAEGAKGDAAALKVEINGASLNAWRSYPLVFEHSGGALETRVFWPGKASLEIGEIVIWERVGP